MEKKKKSTLNPVSYSASQIPHILWNLKVHYCVYRSLPLISALNHINPVHTHPMALDVFYYTPVYAFIFKLVPLLQVYTTYPTISPTGFDQPQSSSLHTFLQLSPTSSNLNLNTLRLCSSLKVRYQGYIQYVLMLMFLESKWEDHVVAGIPQFPYSCMLNRSSRFLENVSTYRLSYVMSLIIIHHHKNRNSKI